MKKSLVTAVLIASIGLTGFTGGTPATFAAENGATSIEAFGSDSLVLSDGTFWMWGGRQAVPTQVVGIEGAVRPLGEGFVGTENGDVYVVERDPLGGAPLKAVKQDGLRDIVKVHGAWDETIAIDADGRVYFAPRLGGRTSAEFHANAKLLTDLEDVIDVAGYYEVSDDFMYTKRWIFLRSDGTVWRNTTELEGFEAVNGVAGVKAIADNLLLKEDGTVWALPTNPTAEGAPTQLPELSNVRKVVSNGKSYAAVDGDGRLYFWGETRTGYSDGTVVHQQAKPIRLTGVANVVDARIAERSLLALTRDGDAYLASVEAESVPSNASFARLTSGVTELQSGARHILMKKQDGTLWGWGVNKNAELGLGDYEFMHDGAMPMQSPIAIVLNGETVALTNGVMLKNGQTFIPLRSVFERLGATPTWNAADRTVRIERAADEAEPIAIVVDYKDGSIELNGKPVTLANDPFIVESTSYLPLRFIGETLGAKVDWEPATRKIVITME